MQIIQGAAKIYWQTFFRVVGYMAVSESATFSSTAISE